MICRIRCPECGREGEADVMIGLVDDDTELRTVGAPASCPGCGTFLRVRFVSFDTEIVRERDK